jgi:hypothetical protein
MKKLWQQVTGILATLFFIYLFITFINDSRGHLHPVNGESCGIDKHYEFHSFGNNAYGILEDFDCVNDD